MYICKVQGKCVSTIKNESLKGYSLITLQKINKTGNPSGDIFVAIDPLGCSIGETVLVTIGPNAGFALKEPNTPIDAVILGIVDDSNFN